MRHKLFVLTVLWCSAFSCARAPTEPDATLAELLAAPTELAFDGVAFQPEVFAWRDFQPSAPADGRPLAVVVRVGQSFPSVTIERIWVIYSGQVWRSTATRVEGTSTWVARDGPKWGPSVTVDVVMQVRHPTLGASLLRRPSVLIGRAD